MGFVKENLSIENWLVSNAVSFNCLKDSEYRKISKGWQNQFRDLITENSCCIKGERAMQFLEDRLPRDVFIFNLPGSKLLPASTSHHEPTLGYSVDKLLLIDRNLFNQFDVIVTSQDFKFSCTYTHEWQSLAHPKFYEI